MYIEVEVWWQEGYDQKRCNATNVSRIKRVYSDRRQNFVASHFLYWKPAEMI